MHIDFGRFLRAVLAGSLLFGGLTSVSLAATMVLKVGPAAASSAPTNRATESGRAVGSNVVFPANASPSIPNVSLAEVAATFYGNPNNSGPFDTSQLSSPVFNQSFSVIDFNPPSSAEVPCSPSTGIDENSRPFTDVVPNSDGTCSKVTVAGGGLQAGVGLLNQFESTMQTDLSINEPGHVTFNVFSDDGWILGLGKQLGGSTQPTYVSGTLDNPPVSSAVKHYSVVGALNEPNAASQEQVTVNFPAAGTYPMEVDYTECCGGQLSLTLGTTAGNPILPTGSVGKECQPSVQHVFKIGDAREETVRVRIIGTCLQGAISVHFGDVPSTNFTVTSKRSILADPPPQSAGTVDVTVTSTGGGTSPPNPPNDQYEYYLPRIMEVSPHSGPKAGGTAVVIRGIGIGGATSVMFGGTSASFAVVKDGRINAVAPRHTKGTVVVSVTNSAGTSLISPPHHFTYEG